MAEQYVSTPLSAANDMRERNVTFEAREVGRIPPTSAGGRHLTARAAVSPCRAG